MKSFLKLSTSLLLGTCLVVFTFFTNFEANARRIDCKWEQEDCPGWGTGSREVCLVDGDGNACTCGEVTRSCDDPEQ